MCSNPSLPSLDPSVLRYHDHQLGALLINVGGRRYAVSPALLASHPDTRLGKLACCGRDTALELCDDADPLRNEFFFDRSAQTFQYVLHYYQTGVLHVWEQQCVASFLQEIQYWGIDELHIHPCCRERYLRRRELQERLDVGREVRALAHHQRDQDFSGTAFPVLRRRLWDLLERPESSRAACVLGTLSLLFVVMSVLSMALGSLDLGAGPWAAAALEALEGACVAWFTAELGLRFLCARDKCGFARRPANIIDLLAVLPSYATLALETLPAAPAGLGDLGDLGRLLQGLRLLRALRMLKLGRHSTGLRALALTLAQCYEEVGLLLLFLAVAISIFATATFSLERDVPGSTFSSVPAAWWWATTSMTTVGYGDIQPHTAPGRLLGFLCIVSGILLLALPIAIINDRFSACYLTLRLKGAALSHAHALRRLARGPLGEEEVGGGVNLRDAYARSILEVRRLRERQRTGARSSTGDKGPGETRRDYERLGETRRDYEGLGEIMRD